MVKHYIWSGSAIRSRLDQNRNGGALTTLRNALSAEVESTRDTRPILGDLDAGVEVFSSWPDPMLISPKAVSGHL